MHEQMVAMIRRHTSAAKESLVHRWMGRPTSSPATKAGFAMVLSDMLSAQ